MSLDRFHHLETIELARDGHEAPDRRGNGFTGAHVLSEQLQRIGRPQVREKSGFEIAGFQNALPDTAGLLNRPRTCGSHGGH
ncbi:MAG: hypothetical protein V9G12_24155 [Microthrixaceae bacterium]